MRTYLKPLTVKAKFKDDICETVDACAIVGTYGAMSTGYNNDYKICVHFPQSDRNGSYYSKNGGQVRKITITGKHVVAFLGAASGVTCNDNITNGDRGGCGWQVYDTTGNGDCHYFGRVTVDGTEITAFGSLPDGVSTW